MVLSNPTYGSLKVSKTNLLYNYRNQSKKKKQKEEKTKRRKNHSPQEYDKIVEVSLNNISKEDVKKNKGVMSILSGL